MGKVVAGEYTSLDGVNALSGVQATSIAPPSANRNRFLGVNVFIVWCSPP